MLINNHIISDSKIYSFLSSFIVEFLYEGEYKELAKTMKNHAYACWHKHNMGLSDHLFLDAWNKIEESAKKEALSLVLIKEFNAYYFDNDPRYIAIKLEKFGEWQNLLSHISCFPMLALKLLDMENIAKKEVKFNFSRHNFIKDKIGFRTIISPHHQLVEDYIYHIGLNESHIHLNGTTTMELLWLDVLKELWSLINDLLNESEGKEHVNRLYALDPILNHPEKFYTLLAVARLTRELLNIEISNPATYKDIRNKKINELISCLKDENFAKLQLKFVDEAISNINPLWEHINEIEFHTNVISYLKEKPKDHVIDTLYLLYIVCMNCFTHLTTQSFHLKGFEQFQKFADNGVRETREKKYTARFYQLHGYNDAEHADLNILEGRFSPKDSLNKNEDLLREILLGFTKYAKGNKHIEWKEHDINILINEALSVNRPKLRLIAHFIKQKEKQNDRFHFEELRNSVNNKCDALLELFFKYPNMRELITGIDVAANELDAPPEVFSPLYRKCRENGIKHFTYHVGEDFKSLLSGIRAIYDAIILLELNNGDRIGHATAIGIDPHYWIKKVPDSFYISQGQLLEDLLFIRRIALEHGEYDIPLYKIEQKIVELSYNIFEENINFVTLDNFFHNRELDPSTVGLYKSNLPIANESEYKRVTKKYQEDKKSIELLNKRWRNKNFIESIKLKDVFNKYKESIIFPKDFIQPEILLKIQQYVQKLVRDRNIVIETLPTSNVRISLYDHIEEHHIFRWLQIKERVFEGDIPMQISLGADDTGIFVTDLRNEFYHLFAVLVKKFQYSSKEALALLSEINENGRIYYFDYKNSRKRWSEIEL